MLRCLSAYLLGMACLGMAIASQEVNPSPSAQTEHICPTNYPADCYPRLFQPTEAFQVVREGQDLPPGLHVRLNVWTGEKEARLNIPMDGDSQLDDLPTEQAIAVVDQPEDSIKIEESALRDRLPQKPPKYDAAGKIQPPRDPEGDGGDSENFWNAIRVLEGASMKNEDVKVALTDLSDLSHDIYYGVETAKREDVLWNLVNLLSSDSPHQRRQAASIIGGAVQNNPTALTEARKAWASRIYPKSGQIYRDKRVCDKENLLNQVHESLLQEPDPAATRAKISALNGLTKDADMRDCFVANLGMEHLLSIFLKEGSQWDSTRVKIAQFVMDTFLDEDMGAQIGVWPRGSAMDSETCGDEMLGNNQGCWEYHLQKMEKEQGSGTDGWLSDFVRLLRRSADALPGGGRRTVDREL